uniref:RRM domain-containing protein n=2 Tax=Manihot esculenta TaxID=3983 RepID=A0A2C9UPK4_MANES
MSYSRRSKYSRSPSPFKRYNRSVSRSLSMSRSRSRDRDRSSSSDVENPGNNLYVTGLSPRITKRDLERHFASEGRVIDVHLVVDPWTRESRGFGFVTMSTVHEADNCIKYLNRSVLEGRVIAVEKAKRRRGRTPTPGRYLGLRTVRVRRRSPSYSPRQSPSYSPCRRSWSRSSCYSSERSRSRSYSPNYRRRRSYSPYYPRRRSYSPYYYSRRRSYSRSSYSRSPISRRDHSYSPYDCRYYSPDDRYYRRHRYHSVSSSPTPRRRSSRRSYSSSISPSPRRGSRRSYSRSSSPASRRSSRRCSRSLFPKVRKSTKRSYSRSHSPKGRKNSRSGCHGGSSTRGYSEDSYSRSPSESCRSGYVSRSVSPRSASPSS